jgi:hypothetical protein
MEPSPRTPEQETPKEAAAESWIDKWRKKLEERRRRQAAESRGELRAPKPVEAERVREEPTESTEQRQQRRIGKMVRRLFDPKPTEQTPPAPESPQLTAELAVGHRARRVGRRILARVVSAREQVMAAAIAAHETPEEQQREVAPLNTAEAHLGDAAEDLTIALHEAEPTQTEHQALPSEREGFSALPDYDYTPLAPRPLETSSPRTEAAIAAATQSAESAKRQARYARDVAVVGVLAGGAALLRDRGTRRQVREVSREQQEGTKKLTEQIKLNEEAVDRMRVRQESLRTSVQRQEVVRQVAHIAEQQVVVSRQSAERIREVSGVTYQERPLGKPATPEAPQKNPDKVEPQTPALKTPELPTDPRARARAFEMALGLPKVEKQQEGPTEQMLSDRVERQPGQVKPLATTANAVAANKTSVADSSRPSILPTPSATTESSQSLAEDANGHIKPTATNTAAWVVVVLVALLAMGALFLINKL